MYSIGLHWYCIALSWQTKFWLLVCACLGQQTGSMKKLYWATAKIMMSLS